MLLMNRDESALWVIDMQERLLSPTHDWQRVLNNTIWLISVAQKLSVSVMASVQYPQGLGNIHDELGKLLPVEQVAEKTHFSCVAAHCLDELKGYERQQCIILGIEAHICVLQTALDLQEQGKDVFIVADAVTSRNSLDKELALKRMAHQGIQIVSKEMVLFEWLKEAGTDEFRAVSREFLR